MTNTCATCGREFEGTEGFIGAIPYCHPFFSSEPTCYMKALWDSPLKFMLPVGDGDGETVTFKIKRGDDGR